MLASNFGLIAAVLSMPIRISAPYSNHPRPSAISKSARAKRKAAKRRATAARRRNRR